MDQMWQKREMLSWKFWTPTLRSSPAGKNLRVGKLWTLTASISLAVESILATIMSSLSLYFSPSFSQMGVSCLQCPHQGASGIRQKNTNKHHQDKITSTLVSALAYWDLDQHLNAKSLVFSFSLLNQALANRMSGCLISDRSIHPTAVYSWKEANTQWTCHMQTQFHGLAPLWHHHHLSGKKTGQPWYTRAVFKSQRWKFPPNISVNLN